MAWNLHNFRSRLSWCELCLTKRGKVLVKRTFLLSAFMLAVILAFAPDRARADEITVAGSTASTPPGGITFTAGSFNGTTSGGYAAFSNLGSYALSGNPGIYNGDVVDVVVTFTLPSGINGSAVSTFVANLFGNVNTSAQGGVTIAFTNPTQYFTFSNTSGNGSFSFTVNTLSVNPGGTTALSGYVSGSSVTPVPEPSNKLLLGAGLLLIPFLRLRRLS
jgi:hypothetical protein